MTQRGLFEAESPEPAGESKPTQCVRGYRRRRAATKTTAEAMALLQRMKRGYIEAAQRVAVEIASRVGGVYSHVVRSALVERGLIPHDESCLWMGRALCSCRKLEWSGKWFSYTDTERCIHERTVKVWRLRAE
jgi:hypothetical protein